jgi:hypothetical protein
VGDAFFIINIFLRTLKPKKEAVMASQSFFQLLRKIERSKAPRRLVGRMNDFTVYGGEPSTIGVGVLPRRLRKLLHFIVLHSLTSIKILPEGAKSKVDHVFAEQRMIVQRIYHLEFTEMIKKKFLKSSKWQEVPDHPNVFKREEASGDKIVEKIERYFVGPDWVIYRYRAISC